MRLLRVSAFGSDGPAKTIVIAERDLRVPIEQAAREMHELNKKMGDDDVDIEIFDGPDDHVAASLMAAERSGKRMSSDERAKEVLSHYLVAALYDMTPNGTCGFGVPAPLDAEVVKEFLIKTMKHKEYKSQTFIVPLVDERVLQAKDGMVLVQDKP